MEHPVARVASSLVRASSRLRPGHPSGHLEPLPHRQACRGGEVACSKHHTCNMHHGRSGPKVFGSNVRNVCFPKHF
jgi:hypothetical protein